MAACLMDSKPLFHDLGTCLILAGIFFSFEKLKTFCDIKEVYCLSLSLSLLSLRGIVQRKSIFRCLYLCSQKHYDSLFF